MTAQCIQRKNIQSFCRTCLTEITKHSIVKGQKYNIHQTQDLAKWIIVFTSLEVKKNDGYPKFLCKECFQKLQSYFEFRSVCIQSMHFLASIVDRNSNVLIEEPEVRTKTEFFDDEDDTPLSMTIANQDRKYEKEKDKRNAGWSSLELGNYDISDVNNKDMDAEISHKNLVTVELESNAEAEDLPEYSQETIKVEIVEEKVLDNKNFEYKNCEDKTLVEELTEVTELASTADCSSDETIEFSLENDNESSEDEMSSENNASRILRSRRRKKDENAVRKKLVCVKSASTKFRCEVCARRCMSEETLAAHLRTHKGLKPYQCKQCERSFNKAFRLKMHIRETHQDNVEYHACSFEGCTKQFIRADTLRSHYRLKHTNVPPPTLKTYMCEDCGRTFKNVTTLKEHRFRHLPTEEYPYQCEQCDKRYTSHRTFKEHQQRHAGIKNFVCPYCGMRKTTRNELRTHINYHTKEKQWPCPHCPSVFNSSANLGIHDRVVHKGIRRYACKYCDQSFGKSDTLKHHEMRHTGEKPHECQECGKRFIQIVALRAHLKTHNKVSKNGAKKIAKQKDIQEFLSGEDEKNTVSMTLSKDVQVD